MTFFWLATSLYDMLMIRLQRVGRTNDPSYRVVVIDSRKGPQSGSFVEILGSYNPRGKRLIQLDAERILHWISKGAQTSPTVHNLLVDQKIIEGKTVPVVPPAKKKEEVLTT